MMKKILSILTIAFLLVGCGGIANYDPENLMNSNEIKSMFSSPDNYKNKSIKITGKIFTEPQKDDTHWALQLWHNPKEFSESFIVYIDSTEESFKEGEYLEIQGVVGGAFEGENLMGGKITAPIINAANIKKSTYKDIMSPTIRKYDVNKYEQQHKVKISIRKIEFSEDETRLYVEIENKSKSKFNLYSYETTAIIGSNQYSVKNNFESDYKELETSIEPGVKDNGVIVLKPIQNYSGRNIKIKLSGSSDNYNLDFNTFIISIKLN